MVKRIIVIFLTILVSENLLSQVQIHVETPPRVVVGQRFVVHYKVNTQNVKEVKIGKTSKIKVLSGPTCSSQSSYTIIGGRAKMENSLVLTYVCEAEKKGNTSSPVLEVRIDGKSVKSPKQKIAIIDFSSSKKATNEQKSTKKKKDEKEPAMRDKKKEDKKDRERKQEDIITYPTMML